MIVHQRFQGSGRTLCNTNYTLTPRTLGLKTLGFLFFERRMIEKKIKEAEWTRQNELTKEQFKQLIVNKLARAKQYHKAVRKREIAQGQL